MCVDFRFYMKTVIGSLLQGRGLFFTFVKGVSYLWQRCLLPLAKVSLLPLSKVSLTFGNVVSYLWQRCLLSLAKVSLTFGNVVFYLWQRCLLSLAKVSLTFGKGVSNLPNSMLFELFELLVHIDRVIVDCLPAFVIPLPQPSQKLVVVNEKIWKKVIE